MWATANKFKVFAELTGPCRKDNLASPPAIVANDNNKVQKEGNRKERGRMEREKLNTRIVEQRGYVSTNYVTINLIIIR